MNFIDNTLKHSDYELWSALEDERNRQNDQIEMIASENFVSANVLAALGSVMTNKYAEGYPGRRYYGGCSCVDRAESLAIDRACSLFKTRFANVQPHSGAQANTAAFYAAMSPGDTFLGLELAMGGHLTHGSHVTVSGKWFNAVSYGLTRDALIDYEQVEELAREHCPKLIIAGASAYSRQIDFKRFRQIADSVGALLMADIAHYAGLIAAGVYDNPSEYADIITTTTHKTLRGPRGGMILSNDENLAKKIDSAVFPGTQGGPQMHSIAAKAVALKEASSDDFKAYARQVIDNARALSCRLQEHGLNIVSGGTDSHLCLLDLSSLNITGKEGEKILENVGITCNKNAIPFDPHPPFVTSGIRLGTAAMTSRGLQCDDFIEIADIIVGALLGEISDNSRSLQLCTRFPLYVADACCT